MCPGRFVDLPRSSLGEHAQKTTASWCHGTGATTRGNCSLSLSLGVTPAKATFHVANSQVSRSFFGFWPWDLGCSQKHPFEEGAHHFCFTNEKTKANLFMLTWPGKHKKRSSESLCKGYVPVLSTTPSSPLPEELISEHRLSIVRANVHLLGPDRSVERDNRQASISQHRTLQCK